MTPATLDDLNKLDHIWNIAQHPSCSEHILKLAKIALLLDARIKRLVAWKVDADRPVRLSAVAKAMVWLWGYDIGGKCSAYELKHIIEEETGYLSADEATAAMLLSGYKLVWRANYRDVFFRPVAVYHPAGVTVLSLYCKHRQPYGTYCPHCDSPVTRENLKASIPSAHVSPTHPSPVGFRKTLCQAQW
jgi:hypothetical protein